MSILDIKSLNNYMSNPQWTEEQQEAITEIIEGLEGQLEGHLSGAYLTPRQMFEVAPILPSGLLATRQPVHSVQEIDGVTVDTGHPLQLPWVLTENRLRNTGLVGPSSGLLVPSYGVAWGAGNVNRVENAGQATVRYMGGWGAQPALVLAVKKKAAAIARNRFDDTIVVSGTDNESTPRPAKEEWTDAELTPLGIFRNLGAKR